ncbi:nitroreductase family protein [uncultured Endozoicomonas sp.]|uniref:nitroreductase family protein n=1 Tax=uncultured Endozoicomonas sp. TaxID=432652 RepID=UPI002618C119|nr:nitroreductase family protein [uncultured Endozoicomonas sp.]
MKTVPLDFQLQNEEQMLDSARTFSQRITKRRTVREFSDKPVPREIIENAIKAAGSAPSGANKQPWHFVAISDPEVKRQVREAAEEEERAFYGGRASDSWLKDLEPFGTDANKCFLETAPWLVAVFLEKNTVDEEGVKHKNYYMPESVGIACGMLLTSLHLSGLATLTHTPSPMKFLQTLLKRPDNEKPYLLVVVGHPVENVEVPDIQRKSLDQIATFID